MAKQKKKTVFFCGECGHDAPQWLGKCPVCEAWNSFKEMTITPEKGARAHASQSAQTASALITPLNQVSRAEALRLSLGSSEFDRVLGGGVFPSTTLLLAGEPGIGKSTLLLQSCNHVASQMGEKVMYVSAEESLDQIKSRSDRLKIDGGNVYCITETNLDKIMDAIDQLSPRLIVLDSIQAVFDPSIESSPGSVTQVREVALRLSAVTKEKGIVLFLIGHVTKDGVVAGPRTLEHMVDVVVYFEGDRYEALRIIRTVKNRYGSTGEVGIFEMTAGGLKEILNPSSIFLPDSDTVSPGRATVALMEGRRPFLVEVQALTNETSFNNPLRRALGVEVNKISLLLAVLERSLGIRFSGYDVFVKVVGGLSIREAACDLALSTAILSSFKNQGISSRTVLIGEIGLGGEIRKVQNLDARIKEAARLGFEKVVIPKNSKKEKKSESIDVIEFAHVRELYQHFFV
jgi:DNA repair protein RadA/Sms